MNLGTLRVVLMSEIQFDLGNRGRTDYGNILELQNSIRDRGLMQPLIVYSPTCEAPYELLGGGRRYLACQALGMQHVSVRIYDTVLSDAEKKAIELLENLHREDLAFFDEVNMKAALHEVLIKMKGEKVGRKPDSPGHSQADTARLLKESPTNFGLDLKLARAIRDYPELRLRQAKNKNHAMQILARFEVAFRNRVATNQINEKIAKVEPQAIPQVSEATADRAAEALAILHRAYGNGAKQETAKVVPLPEAGKAVRVEAPPKPAADISLGIQAMLVNAYKLGDFFDYSHLENHFSFIEVDPPYGIDIVQQRKADDKSRMESEYEEVDSDEYMDFLHKLLDRCYKLATEDAWMVLWCGPQWMHAIHTVLAECGWNANKIPGIWKKGNSPGQTNSPTTNLGNAYEMFLYARKGKMQLHTQGHGNIFDYPGVPRSQRIHPTERPRELMREILRVFAWPKSHVLVPFAGSGVTISAAFEMGFQAIGHDKSREFREAYVARVLEEYKQTAFA